MKPAGAKLPGALGKVTSVPSPGDPSRVLTRWEGRRPKRCLPSGTVGPALTQACDRAPTQMSRLLPDPCPQEEALPALCQGESEAQRRGCTRTQTARPELKLTHVERKALVLLPKPPGFPLRARAESLWGRSHRGRPLRFEAMGHGCV